MYVKTFVRLYVTATLAAASCLLTAGQTSSLPGSFLANNTPGFIHAAGIRNLGPENPSKIIDVSLWLKLHNRPGFDALARELYDPNSTQFRNWLKRDEFARQYAPTAAEAAQVADYLRAHGLRVVSIGQNHMYVRAQGSVGIVSKAFRVALNRYQVKDKIYRMNAGDPYLEGATAALIASVAGLDTVALGASLVASPFSAPSFTSNCFGGVIADVVIGSPGTYPFAYVFGNEYISNPAGPICGYTPSDIQTAYNLKALYQEGYDGTGQTVVIIAWCGSPTIRQDANAFSARYGLPPLTNSNFSIVNYPGPSTCSGVNPQINRDVEWVHAIAPGANIALVVPPGADTQDVDQAQYYAIMAGLGNIISGAYGIAEYYQAPAEMMNANLLNEIAAVFGISANFPVGDQPTSNDWGVWGPATSPYATAVGGTTVALNKNGSLKWQIGWGTWATSTNAWEAFEGGSSNPSDWMFENGSTGGASQFFAAPAYQKSVSTAARVAPDISWLADSVTGAVVEVTLAPQQPPVLKVYGGSGLACAMFSGLWAIANQEAGAPLGQAAPYLYSMPAGTITDILKVTATTIPSYKTSPVGWFYTDPTNKVEMWVTTNSPTYGATWKQPGQVNLLSLGYNPLKFDIAAPGWDVVTGLGTPNGKAFADYFNPAR